MGYDWTGTAEDFLLASSKNSAGLHNVSFITSFFISFSFRIAGTVDLRVEFLTRNDLARRFRIYGIVPLLLVQVSKKFWA